MTSGDDAKMNAWISFTLSFQLQKISCDLLENTKQQYCSGMPALTKIKTEPADTSTIKQEYNSIYDKSMYFYKAVKIILDAIYS